MKSLLFVALLFFVSNVSAIEPAGRNGAFWQKLERLCGKAYPGTVASAPANDTTFKGKKIVMHVVSCQREKIKITLLVGSDRSRTWVFRQYQGRLLLKHEHRKKDGSSADVDNYGGWTSNAGSATRQVFPADQETMSKIPEAASNVWWIDLETGKHFIYNLVRIGTDRRYSLKFDLGKTVKVPRLLSE